MKSSSGEDPTAIPSPQLPNPIGSIQSYTWRLYRWTLNGWNRFWFTPRSAYWLGILRIAAGIMLLYTHWIWGWDFDGFLGPERRISEQFIGQMNPTSWHWSHFDWIQDPTALGIVHWLGLACLLAFTLGLGMPWTGWLSVLFAISYAHRATGALFGLDQMNVALVTYLTLGRAGRHWSLDRWWKLRQAGRAGQGGRSQLPAIHYDVWTNIGTRLIQIQLCIIYWFAGTGKLQGVSWWNGEALWGAFASYQYQSVDLTWLYNYPIILALLTHITIVWEVGYTFLVWPRWSRPLMVTMAVLVHTGIGLFLGMMTFGYIMVVANLSFVEWPQLFPPADRHRDDFDDCA